MSDQKWDQCQPPFPPLSCAPDGFSGHNYSQGAVGAVNAALGAGVDVNCGPLYRMWLAGLVANGSVAEALLDVSVARVYTTAMSLGLLDTAVPQVYAGYGAESVDSAEHRALALRAAQESLVLLKNDGVLPLAPGLKLAFIGPHANATQDFLSNYHGSNTLVDAHSPLAVARARGWAVSYARGCNICDVTPPGFPNMPCPPGAASNASMIPAAAAAAAAADVAILFVGLDQTSEAENFDRDTLALPGVQDALVAAVLAAQPNTVLVLVHGGPVAAPAAFAGARAILDAVYGGELAGDAIVDALTGAAAPAGKLAMTYYFNNITNRDIRDMDLSSAGGITPLMRATGAWAVRVPRGETAFGAHAGALGTGEGEGEGEDESVFHRATRGIVEALLAAGADVRAVDAEGRTALHHFAADESPAFTSDPAGRLAAARRLIAAGAAADARDAAGRTPGEAAAAARPDSDGPRFAAGLEAAVAERGSQVSGTRAPVGTS